MADFRRLVETNELKINRLASIASGEASGAPYMSYDEEFDALVLLAVEPESDLIAHYVDDHVALLYEEASREIVGLQVENFERSFVPKHADLKKTWTLSSRLGQKLENLGDMMLAVERQKPLVAREVIRAAGAPKELAEVFAA